MSACLADNVSRDTQAFEETALRIYTGPDLDPKDLAVTRQCVEALVQLGATHLRKLFQQIAQWREDLACGKIAYDERDDRCFRYVLEKDPGRFAGPSWCGLLAVAQSEGAPIRGLDELTNLLEEARKMLQEWSVPVAPGPSSTASLDSPESLWDESTVHLSERDAEQVLHHLEHPPAANAKAMAAAARFQQHYGRVDD